MKYCTMEMFTKFGVEPSEGIEKGRLCPDIPLDFNDYKVQGSFSNKVNRTSFSLQIR